MKKKNIAPTVGDCIAMSDYLVKRGYQRDKIPHDVEELMRLARLEGYALPKYFGKV